MSFYPLDRNAHCDFASATEVDEREFAAFAEGQDPLDIEAATWASRKRSGLDAQGEAELLAWLAADPRHAEALEDMEGTFEDLKHLPDDDVATLRSSLPDRERSKARLPACAPMRTPPLLPQTPSSHARRPWLAGLRALIPQAVAATLVVGVIGGGWSYWHQLPVFEQVYATERGQQLNVNLADAPGHSGGSGSVIRLDTATRLQATLYRDRREVRLDEGQAVFDIHSDPSRPFHVHAGRLSIMVVGTRFAIRHTHSGMHAGQTVISVEEGRVQVIGTAQTGGADTPLAGRVGANRLVVELGAGETVVADLDGQIGTVASMPSGELAQWREGRLSFDQTPLAEVIAEFERYGRTGLVVRDPEVAALPVGGSYSVRHFAHFTNTLPQVLPVRLVRRGEVTEVVAR